MALTNLMTAITLDVYDHNATQTSIKSISCDSNTRFVRAALTYAHVPYKVSVDAAVTLTVVRPDGAAVSIEGEAYNSGSANTDRIVAELTDVATAVKGSLLAQFKIEDGNQVLRTEVFKIDNGVALDIDSDKWADTYQGYDLSEFEQRIIELEADTITTLIGNTPLTLSEDMNVRLASDTPATYTLGGIVIANYDKNDGLVLNNVEMVRENGRMHFTAIGDTWDQCYVEMTIQGLIVGNTYTFQVDKGAYVSKTSGGNFDLYDGNGNYVTSIEPAEGTVTKTFTAATSNARITFYPVPEYYWGGTYNLRDCLVDGFGINATRTGSFTKTSNLGILQAGTEISSEPSVQVYSLTQKDAVVVDEDFSATSKNPVQNRRVTAAIGSLNDLNTSAKSNLVAAINEAANSSGTRLAGKRCVFLGDSVAAFRNPPEDIPSIVGLQTGMTVYNCAFGGCRISDNTIAEGTDDPWEAFCFARLADGIATGDWSYQEANIAKLQELDYTGYSPSDHFTTLKGVNWNNVDYCVIFFAGNDPGNVRFDDPNNSENRYYYLGAFRYGIKKMLTAYPHLKLLVVGTDYHKTGGSNTDERTYTMDGQTYYYCDWSDRLMAECKNLKLPTLDWYRSNGLNALTVDYYMTSDGKHPNYIGNQFLGGQIAARLLSQY